MPSPVSYFVMQGDEQFGPMTLAQLQGYFRSGQFTGESTYWTEGMDDWRPLSEISSQLGLKRRGEKESREEQSARQREKRARDSKKALRQTAFIVLALFLLIAIIATVFYFLGQLI